MTAPKTNQLPAHWPFATEAEHARYEALRAAGYAQLKQAHELFMQAIGRVDREVGP